MITTHTERPETEFLCQRRHKNHGGLSSVPIKFLWVLWLYQAVQTMSMHYQHKY